MRAVSRIERVTFGIAVGIAFLMAWAWIALTIWASGSVKAGSFLAIFLAESASEGNLKSTLGLSVLLVLIVVQSGEPRQRITGQFIAGLLFAIVAAALVASHALGFEDTLAAMCLLYGVAGARRSGMEWLGIMPVGLACACTPLAAGAVLIYLRCRVSLYERIVIIILTGVIATVAGSAVRWLVDPTWMDALAVSSDVARLGPQNVWRVAAERGDLVSPVLLLAMLAVCEQFFVSGTAEQGKPGEIRETPETLEDRDHRFERLASVWLGLNVLVGICMPRVVVSHGLMFVLPAFLLVPAGWRVLCTLPVTRSHWTLSLFTLSCWALILLLLWVPVRTAGEKILVALTLT